MVSYGIVRMLGELWRYYVMSIIYIACQANINLKLTSSEIMIKCWYVLLDDVVTYIYWSLLHELHIHWVCTTYLAMWYEVH